MPPDFILLLEKYYSIPESIFYEFITEICLEVLGNVTEASNLLFFLF
jgi:hypothetical protein